MGMDVDYLFAKQAIDKLSEILCDINHGERKDICDDILEFVSKI